MYSACVCEKEKYREIVCSEREREGREKERERLFISTRDSHLSHRHRVGSRSVTVAVFRLWGI